MAVLAGLDLGVRYCGLAVLRQGRLAVSERQTLPRELTAACYELRLWLEVAVNFYHIEVLAVEGFTFHREKGSVTTAAAMYQLLGTVRSLHGWGERPLAVRVVEAGLWGRRLTGLRVPPKGPGRAELEWKRQVAWYVEQRAGGAWRWEDDKGWHRRDAAGIAFYVADVLALEGRVSAAQGTAGGRR